LVLKLYSYNEEIEKATAQFIDLFNNLIIKRRDATGNVVQLISVPCLYGNRSIILKYYEDRNMTLKLPVMVVNMINIYKDVDRIHSVNDALYFSSDGEVNPIYNMGIPINIAFDVEYVAKYQEDVDQIFCNYTAAFNPDVYVVWKNPYGGESIKSQIVWSGIVTMDYGNNINTETPQRIYAKTSFVFKTWLFPGNGKTNHLSDITINKINVNDYGDGLNSFYEVPYAMTYSAYTENIENGLIKYPNYDTLSHILTGALSGFVFDNIVVSFSGTIYNPTDSDDLEYILSNFTSSDDVVVGYGTNDQNIIVPSEFIDVDFYDIFTRMSSGDLSLVSYN
jgi:hypothetical protein